MSLSPTTSAAKSPQDLAAMEAPNRELINERLALSKRERDVLNAILTWSLARGREWAVFRSVEQLAERVGLARPHASAVLSDLEDMHLLHRVTRYRELRLRFLPDGVLVSPEMRIAPERLAAIDRDLAELNAMPPGFEPCGQKLLPLETASERLDDDQAEESRKRAVAHFEAWKEQMRGGCRTENVRCASTDDEQRTEKVRSSPVSDAPAPYRKGTEEVPATAARPRASVRVRGHGHEMKNEYVMSHGHERSGAKEAEREAALASQLGEIQFELLQRIEVLLEPEPLTPSFRILWMGRMLTRFGAVREAVEEVELMKRERKIRKSCGGTLNACYKDFSGEAAKP